MFHKVKQLFIRNSVIILLAAAFIAAAGSFAFAETAFSGSGSGTEEDSYIVSSLSELQEISTAVKNGHDFSGQYICLTQDIDLPEDTVMSSDLALRPAEAAAPPIMTDLM